MEMLDIVDKDDNVLDIVSRDESYKKNLRHRIVHVLIFDNEGRMLLQRRSKKVKTLPNYWSTAVGGHVQSGESYKDAALREYEEELGTTSNIELFKKDHYKNKNGPDKILSIFKSIFTGPFNPDPKVVSEIRFFTINEMKDMIDNGEKFHPELVFLLNKYFF